MSDPLAIPHAHTFGGASVWHTHPVIDLADHANALRHAHPEHALVARAHGDILAERDADPYRDAAIDPDRLAIGDCAAD